MCVISCNQDKRIEEVRETYFNLSMTVCVCRSRFTEKKVMSLQVNALNLSGKATCFSRKLQIKNCIDQYCGGTRQKHEQCKNKATAVPEYARQ